MVKNNDSMIKLSDTQQKLFQLVFDLFMKEGQWPNSRFVQVLFDKTGNLWTTADESMLKFIQPGDKYDKNSQVKLTVLGISFCENSDLILSPFIDAIKICVSLYKKTPTNPKITFSDFCALMDSNDKVCHQICLLMRAERGIWGPSTFDQDGKTIDFELSPDILELGTISSISDYLKIVKEDYIRIKEFHDSHSETGKNIFLNTWIALLPHVKKYSGYNILDKIPIRKSVKVLLSILILVIVVYCKFGYETYPIPNPFESPDNIQPTTDPISSDSMTKVIGENTAIEAEIAVTDFKNWLDKNNRQFKIGFDSVVNDNRRRNMYGQPPYLKQMMEFARDYRLLRDISIDSMLVRMKKFSINPDTLKFNRKLPIRMDQALKGRFEYNKIDIKPYRLDTL